MTTTQTKPKTLLGKYMLVLQDIKNFAKNTEGVIGSRKYGYLSLDELLIKAKPIFAAHDLAFRQGISYIIPPSGEPMGVLDTYVFDETEEKEMGHFPFYLDHDIKKTGGDVTYTRRYTLYALLDIFPEYDTDGNYTSPKAKQSNTSSQTAAAPQQEPKITQDDLQKLRKLAKMKGRDLKADSSKRQGRQLKSGFEITESTAQLLRAEYMGLPDTQKMVTTAKSAQGMRV